MMQLEPKWRWNWAHTKLLSAILHYLWILWEQLNAEFLKFQYWRKWPFCVNQLCFEILYSCVLGWNCCAWRPLCSFHSGKQRDYLSRWFPSEQLQWWHVNMESKVIKIVNIDNDLEPPQCLGNVVCESSCSSEAVCKPRNKPPVPLHHWYAWSYNKWVLFLASICCLLNVYFDYKSILWISG